MCFCSVCPASWLQVYRMQIVKNGLKPLLIVYFLDFSVWPLAFKTEVIIRHAVWRISLLMYSVAIPWSQYLFYLLYLQSSDLEISWSTAQIIYSFTLCASLAHRSNQKRVQREEEVSIESQKYLDDESEMVVSRKRSPKQKLLKWGMHRIVKER